jgi:methyltransferase (TIGR00027 family)
MTAAARARESARPDRLFDDPFAGVLADDEGVAFLEEQESLVAGGAPPIFVVRHRFFDDFLIAQTSGGIRQVVLVAAGLDTRAFRLAWPTGVDVYELDQPDVLAYKQVRLDEVGATATCQRRVVPVDLTHEWDAALCVSGYRSSEPAVWLAEGLLFYLPEPVVDSLLETAAALSPPGSSLGTDTMSSTMLASSARQHWVRFYRDAGAPFVFGTDQPSELLARHGWRPTIHLAPELAAQYGRSWRPAPTPGPPLGAIITAERAH